MLKKTTIPGWSSRLQGAAAGLGLLALSAGSGQAAPAAANEELALMEMYFSDERLVEAATRHPKPIVQVAENVTIITAAEIEAMHAHSVAEVLERVPGVFVQHNGRGFANDAAIHIHGSDYEHVLVLVDGVRWNLVGSDFAKTQNIPVSIIDRIEVVKGAASSAWGSSLGGVVNIITKNPGTTRRPRGQAEFAAGEHDTEHYHAELAGEASGFGYYLFGGRRESQGIKDDRFFDSKSLYAKISRPLPDGSRFTGLLGYSAPEYKNLHFEPFDFGERFDERFLWYAASLESPLTPDLQFYLQLYGQDQRSTKVNFSLATNAPFAQTTADGEQRGVNSRLAWEHGRHLVVLGTEYLYRENTDHDELTNYQASALSEEILAVYLNDTIRYGRLTVIPGLRYDHLSLAEDQVNPSLGLTYRLSGDTLLRTHAARGFRKPAAALQEGDPQFHPVNPALENETIWTFQAGVETVAVPALWLKANLFYHDADEVWVSDPATGAWINGGSAQRTGLELAAKTSSFHGFAVGANYTLVHLEPVEEERDQLYKVDLLFEYANSGWGLAAELYGRYVWWSEQFTSAPFPGQYDDFLWDLVLRQKIFNIEAGEAELFFKAHNLFNSAQYWISVYENAPRWVEAGLTFRF